MSSRRKFSTEFKAEAVELVISSDRPIAQVAVDIGVNEGTLGNWVRSWREEHPEAGANDPGPVEWAKFKELQVENAELKREVDFLKKGSPCRCRKRPLRSVSPGIVPSVWGIVPSVWDHFDEPTGERQSVAGCSCQREQQFRMHASRKCGVCTRRGSTTCFALRTHLLTPCPNDQVNTLAPHLENL